MRTEKKHVSKSTGVNVVSLISLFSFCAAGKLGYWNEGDHIHYNVVTKQKLVADVCFQVCTVPPFLPLTVALGITLSKNFHGWLLPLSSLLAYPSAQGSGTQSSTAANRGTHTLNPFPAVQYQMDGKQGCFQVQITSCSWMIESHNRE